MVPSLSVIEPHNTGTHLKGLEASFLMVPSLSMIEPHNTGIHLEGLEASFLMVPLLFKLIETPQLMYSFRRS